MHFSHRQRRTLRPPPTAAQIAQLPQAPSPSPHPFAALPHRQPRDPAHPPPDEPAPPSGGSSLARVRTPDMPSRPPLTAPPSRATPPCLGLPRDGPDRSPRGCSSPGREEP